jgi:hypothetical protein
MSCRVTGDFMASNSHVPKRNAGAIHDRSHRQLWSAVVLQAKEDVQDAPLDSVTFAQAISFFTGSGEWIEARRMIIDFLELHPDDLEAIGRRCINDAPRGRRPVAITAPAAPHRDGAIRSRRQAAAG